MPIEANPDTAFSDRLKAKLQSVVSGEEEPSMMDKMEPKTNVELELTIGPDIEWASQIKQGLLVIVPDGAILSQLDVEVNEVNSLLDFCLMAPEQGLIFVRPHRDLYPYLRVLDEKTAGFSFCKMTDAPGSVSPVPAEWALAVDRFSTLDYQWLMRKVRTSVSNQKRDQSERARVGTDDAPPRDLADMMKAGENRRGIIKPGEFNKGNIDKPDGSIEDTDEQDHGGNG